MLGYEPYVLTIVGLALGAGGFVKGLIGMGLPIAAIAIMLNFLDPRSTLAILVGPILVTNLWMALRSGNLRQPLRRFWPLICSFVVFLFIGAKLLVELDERILFGLLGACVTVFAASSLLRPHARPLKPVTERWMAPIVGVVSGLLGGISTIWGPPLVVYLVRLQLDKESWIRTIGLVWFLGSVPLTIAYWQNGILDADTAPLTAYACLPAMVGMLLGSIVRQHLPQETFRKVLLAALVVIGMNLIRRALF